MNPAAALQSAIEDFLEFLEQSPGPAQAELINLFLRSCGCNDTVSADDAVDYDGVVDNLDNITEALKQVRAVCIVSQCFNSSRVGQFADLPPNIQTASIQEVQEVSFGIHRAPHYICRRPRSVVFIGPYGNASNLGCGHVVLSNP